MAKRNYLKKIAGIYFYYGFKGVIKALKNKISRRNALDGFPTSVFFNQNYHSYIPLSSSKKKDVSALMVSVIVPNYNHADFLEERLDSIYNQTYGNYEVILLDDVSSDHSREILERYQKKYPEKTKLLFNEQNSGSPYKQWKKGITAATGDLIWIAESDDFCDLNFLEEHVTAFEDDAVMLSFSPSIFIKNGKKCDSSYRNLADCIPKSAWEKSFVVSAHKFVNQFLALKNVIINVSACVFRKVDFTLLDQSDWFNYRLCGDWIFYLNLIVGGKVAYNNGSINYYRIHAKSTSLSVQKQLCYYKEHEKVACEIVRLYKVNWSAIQKNHYVLETKFKRDFGNRYQFKDFYDLNNVIKCFAERKPNILMCCYALISGGGETFPISLANGLKKRGFPVTLFDFAAAERNLTIKQRILKNIPIVKNQGLINNLIEEFGIDVVHTHHAFVDSTFADVKSNFNNFKHIITMHGMYELMDNFEQNCAPQLSSVNHWVYIAEKNIQPFIQRGINIDKFSKITNAIEKTNFVPKKRSELGIPEDAFVFCLVSRAIPEKGWKESIKAVSLCRKETGRDIHLILVGDGPMYEKLKDSVPNYVHMVGFQADIKSYFSIANMGLVASSFKGESVPLAILESYAAGTPVLATHIGEIPFMLSREGKKAGMLCELDDDGNLSVNKLSSCMTDIVSRPAFYEEMRSNVPFVAKQFDFEEMLNKYITLYES